MSTVLSIIILAALVWFIIANMAAVSVTLFLWVYTAPFALIAVVIFALGFLLGVLRLAPGWWRFRSAARHSGKTVAELTKERDALTEKVSVLESQIAQLAPVGAVPSPVPARTESAGGIVLNQKGEVCVTNQRGDSWSLPKGHVDPGETPLEAARREVAEETGLTDLTLVRELGSYERYKIGKGGVGENMEELKHITMFLFRTNESDLKPTDSYNPEARWVEVKDVAALLTHPKDRAFFEGICDSL